MNFDKNNKMNSPNSPVEINKNKISIEEFINLLPLIYGDVGFKIEKFNDNDFRKLQQGIFKLNWEVLIDGVNDEDFLDLKFLIKDKEDIIGYSLAKYDKINKEIIILGIEKVTKKEGFNFELLTVALEVYVLFSKYNDCENILVDDVEKHNKKLLEYYKRHGFEIETNKQENKDSVVLKRKLKRRT